MFLKTNKLQKRQVGKVTKVCRKNAPEENCLPILTLALL